MKWKQINLGDAATFINGYPFKPEDWKDEGLEIIRIQNLTGSSSEINYFQGQIDEKYKVKKGDLLISWSATLGIYEWDKPDGWLNQHIFKVVFNKHNFDKTFFKYLISNRLASISSEVHGSTMKHITKQRFDKIPIPLPPLATQQKIASILDAAEAYRQKTKALIEKYDQLAQSMFLKIFGDPVTNPNGFKKAKFENLVSNDCPLTYGIVQPGDEYENGIPCVRPIDLISQYIDVSSLKKIAPEISNRFKRTILKGNEILLSVRGSIGLISIATPTLVGSNVTRGIVPVWFEEKSINKLFFYYLYKTQKIQDQIIALAKGATLIQINLSDLRSLELISPPFHTQTQFAERIQWIEAQKQKARATLIKADELFNSLLQSAFKGELVE